VLVFLANIPETTSHEIERGTDIRQPEVSLAIQYLTDRGWVTSSENKQESIGRPLKVYKLAKPITEIVDSLEKEIEKKANNQRKLIIKIRNFIK
jgi:predicted transcriptional regulator